MIRAVCDSNVLVSGFPASSGTMAALIDHWRSGHFQLIVSQHIIEEVGRAWTKPYWRARLSQAQIDHALTLLQAEAEVTPITVQVADIAAHHEDDLVLAAAVSAHVDRLVTGDRQLLAIGSYGGIVILSPPAFLGELARASRR